MEEAKHAEEPPTDHEKQEAESPRKPDLLSPVSHANRDGLQPLDDPGHWNTASKERKRETPASSAASSLIASDPPVNAKLDRREQ